jgi:hypothetical protein
MDHPHGWRDDPARSLPGHTEKLIPLPLIPSSILRNCVVTATAEDGHPRSLNPCLHAEVRYGTQAWFPAKEGKDRFEKGGQYLGKRGCEMI